MMDWQKVHSEAAPVRTGREEAKSWHEDNSDVRVFEARDPSNGLGLMTIILSATVSLRDIAFLNSSLIHKTIYDTYENFKMLYE